MMLVTGDSVLRDAIPAQLRHALDLPCTVLADAAELAAALAPSPPVLVLLDCAAEGVDAALPARLRHDHPLMALIGIGGAEEDAAFHLPLAAFLHRPLSMPALLRRIEQLGYERALHAGQQRLDFPQQAAFHPAEKCIRLANGQTVELTDKETALLLCLYHHRQGWLPRARLLEEVWGYGDAITTHTLETHLYRLRGKLRDAFGGRELVVTQNGGYRLELHSDGNPL